MAAKPLAGRGILVTRPAGQAGGLAARIAELGGMPVLFPGLEIGPPSDVEALARQVADLPGRDLAIFISPTAVERFLPSVLAHHGGWPPGVRPAAVGQASAGALARLGVRDVLVTGDGSDSESLLALPELAVVGGKRVLIVRGEGGRELLADTLRRRGAEVGYAECYRRLRPDADAAPLRALWQAGGVAAVTVTSRELFANLADLLGPDGAPLLLATPLFAPHERIAAAARQWGVQTVVATAPGDAGLVSALSDWFNRRHG
jgi:uroporphyrinogen-III synthase